jgi:hypothetical protein
MKFYGILILLLYINTNEAKNFGICDSETFNKVFCENKSQNKVRYRVQAVYSNSNQSEPKQEVFSIKMPINTCKPEDCEFCCLSTNKCGTKRQCENSKYYIQYVNYIFFTLIAILILAFIIKWNQIDPYPEQSSFEKIENMNDLINMFGIVRNNRKKLIT